MVLAGALACRDSMTFDASYGGHIFHASMIYIYVLNPALFASRRTNEHLVVGALVPVVIDVEAGRDRIENRMSGTSTRQCDHELLPREAEELTLVSEASTSTRALGAAHRAHFAG